MRLVKRGVLAIAVVLVFAVSGCAFNASPADDLRFRPPAGWRPSPGILGFMQFWRSAASDREVLMLFKSPKPLEPRDVFSNAREHDAVTNVVVERRENITICGNQPATYVLAHGSSSNGSIDRMEIVTANVRGNTYFAIYVHPLRAPANRMAEAALRELCAKS